MQSPAALAFKTLVGRSDAAATFNDQKLRRTRGPAREFILHSLLASYVAAWQAYVIHISDDFFTVVRTTLDPQSLVLLDSYKLLRDQAVKRFNTPNWDNTRNLLVNYTGYDPINDWVWPRRSMGVQQVKARLDEILKVRHSFAHGFAIPAYSWTQSPSGRVRLTLPAAIASKMFFQNLVSRTDAGMARYIARTFRVDTGWA